jgi:restriction enzyme
MLKNNEIESLVHLSFYVIGITFSTTAFCLKKGIRNSQNNYFKLFDKVTRIMNAEDCDVLFRNCLKNKNYRYKFTNRSIREEILENTASDPNGIILRYNFLQKDFEKIPGSPIAYWVSDKVREIFEKNQKLGDIGEAKVGLQTADNNRFLRLWNEVNYNKIGYNISSSQEALESKKKWFPYNKGGEFRKWYGNQEYLVNWENDGYEIKNFYDEKGKLRSRPQNTEYYFKESISWGLITPSS